MVKQFYLTFLAIFANFYVVFGQCDTAPLANFERSDNFIISGQPVTFRNRSVPNGNNVRYVWNWGDNTPNTITTNTTDVTHTYHLAICTSPNDAIGATFRLTLTIENLTDPLCGDFSAAPVTVYRPCQAIILGIGRDTVCAGVPMELFNNSCPRNPKFTYLWNFGDPSSAPLDTTSSAADRVTHIYTQTGTYNVTLTGNGFGLSSVARTTVVVLPQVFARATYTTSGNCAPVQVILNNNSTEAENVTYRWTMASNATFVSNTSATYKNPIMRFTQIGSHSIHLETRHRCGNRTWDSMVVVNDKPDIALDPMQNVCIPNRTTPFLQNISTGGLPTTYNWTFQDALPATFVGTTPPALDFQSEGVKEVQIVATNSCGTSTASRFVEVGVPPVIQATIDLPATHCAPFPLITHNSSIGNITNEWTVLTEAGGIPPDTNFVFTNNTNKYSARPEFQFLKQGSYKLKLLISNPCDTKTWESAVFTVKAAPISVIDTILPTCNNLYTPRLTTFEEGGLTTTYDWRFQNSQPASANTRTLTQIRSENFGIQRIELTSTNACGIFKDTAWVNIRPHALLDAGLLDTTTTTHCAPFRVETKNRTQYATTQVWSVTTESGNTPPQGSYEFLDNTNEYSIAPIVNFISEGRYFLKLNITNPCKDTVWKSPLIQVQTKPRIQMDTILKGCPPLVVTPQVDTLNGSAGISSFTWQCASISFANPNQFNQNNLNFNTVGRHLLRLMAQNRCGADTTQRIVEVIQPADIQVNRTALPANNCLPFNVKFNNHSIGAAVSTWTVNPNVTVVANTPDSLELNFATVGTYRIQLNITNVCGNKNWESTIIVHDKPNVRLQPLTLAGNCTPQTVQPVGILTTDGGLSTQITWNCTTDNRLNPAAVVYNEAGTFPVTIEARNACGISQDNTSFTIQSRPNLQIRPNRDTFCNTDAPYQLTFAPQNGFWFNTTTNSVTRLGLFTPVVGQHTLTFQAGTGDCVVKDSIKMFVYGTVVTAGADITKCDTASAPFQLSGGTPAGGWWTGNGIIDAVSGTFSPTVAGAGEHTMTYHFRESRAQCENIATRKVTIFRKPKAIIDSLPISCINTPVAFNNLSATGLSARWYFGDNLTSTAFSPTHAYTQAGSYSVRLLVKTADGCEDSTNRAIVIAKPPVPRFSVVPAEGCTDLLTTINNDGSQNNVNTTYFWRFGNGDSSSVFESGQRVFKNTTRGVRDTIYTILLTASHPGCPAVTESHTVKVFPLPKASFGLNIDTICSTDSVRFHNNSLGCDAYRWNLGLGNNVLSQLTQPAPQQYITDTIFKTYKIQLIGSNRCGSDTVTRNVTVRPITTKAFFTVSTLKGCAPLEIQVTNRATLGAQVSYKFGSNGTSLDPNPRYTFTQSGQFEVKQYAKLGCGYDTMVQQVTVLPIPLVDFEYATLICRNKTMIFTNLSGQNIANASWRFGDNKTSTEIHPTHRYDTSGTFRVALTIQSSDSNRCYATVEKRIPILPELSLNLDSIIQTKCFAATGGAVFSGRNGALPYLYALNNPNSFSNASGVFTNLDINRNYTIYMKDAEGCRDSQKVVITGSIPFTINVGDDQQIFLGDSVLMAAAASRSNVRWRWTGKEGIFCDTCSTTFLKPLHTTRYHVFATDANGCKNQDSVLITVIPTYKVFIPNVFSPNGDAINDYFYPQTDRSVRRVLNFQIFNRAGGMVFQKDNFPPNDMNLGWDGLNGDTGVYAYWMEVEFLDGNRVLYKGDVTLVR